MKIEDSHNDIFKYINEDVSQGCTVYFYKHKNLLSDKNYHCVYTIMKNMFISNKLSHLTIDKIAKGFESSVSELSKNYSADDEALYGSIVVEFANLIERYSLLEKYIDPLGFLSTT